MTYATIEDGESTPLQDGGYSVNGTTSGSSSTNQRGSFATVRAVMVGATVMGALVLLRMAGPSTMMRTKSSSSTVDSMVVVSSAATQKNDPCLVAGGNFNWNNNDRDGLSPNPFETCYQWKNEAKYCWSKSHYSSDDDDDSLGRYTLCVPLPFDEPFFAGFSDGWHTHSSNNLHPIHYCGPPCTTMKGL